MGSSLTSLASMLVQALKLHSTFPALGWLVLNRLVFESYLEERDLIGWWTDLDAAGQVALMVLVALFISYVLDSLNFILLDMFESKKIHFAWSPLDKLVLLLGSELTDGKGRIERRYGIDPGIMWSHLMSILSENGYAALVEREKANLDFFLNLFVLSLLFLAECVLTHTLGWPGSALIPWAALVAAYVFYRLTIPCAKKWYDWMNAAFDLYRHQLAKQLALKPFKDNIDERMTWTAISLFLKLEVDDFDQFYYQ